MRLVSTFRLSISLALASTSLVNATSTAGMATMRAVQYESGCLPEQMQIKQVPRPTLRSGEILIKVHSSAINRAETLQRKGLYPPIKGESEILGLEAAGEVVETHEVCHKTWNIGDHVMALLPGGGNAEYVTVDSQHAMKVPKSMSLLEAGGIPEVWLTAYQILHFVGKLKAGEKVLIHAGASGVGTAAVQLVQLANAVPLITAGSADKIAFVKSLGAVDGFNYKEGSWVSKVMEATNGEGVDLVIDCVGGSYWQQNTDVLKTDGRWVLYGLMGGANVDGALLRKLLSKRISILPSTLKTRNKQYKADLIRSFETNILPAFDSKALKPVIDRSFELEDIGKAHALMESNLNAGKILLKVIPTTKEEL